MCAGCFTDTRVLRLFEVAPLFVLVQYFVFVFYPGVTVVNLPSPLRTRYVRSNNDRGKCYQTISTCLSTRDREVVIDGTCNSMHNDRRKCYILNKQLYW